MSFSDESGRWFGRYRITEQLGAGGMAVVYRAVLDGPEGFQRSVVIKKVRPDFSEDPNFVKMLLAEARLSALLQHPNIVQVFELGQADNEYYLAMELVEGANLVSILKRIVQKGMMLPPGLAIFMVSEVAAALAYAHDLKDDQDRHLDIVHRDISPSNVMITNRGAVKLLDFGIAKAADHISDDKTRAGTIKGKICYFSPEQAEGHRVDRRTDIFALGVVLHELLTMKRLFRGDDDFHSLRLVREANVAPPSSMRPDLDKDIDAAVLKMLARNVEERFQTCDEVHSALAPLVHKLHGDAASMRKFLDELGPIDEKPMPRRGSSPSAMNQTGSKPPSTTLTKSTGEMVASNTQLDSQPSQRRGRGLTLGIAGVGSAVAAAAAAFFISRPPTPQAPALAVAGPQVINTAPLAAAPVGTSVRLKIYGTSGADVLVDGKKKGSLPFDVNLDRQGQARTIRVEKPGFVPFEVSIAGDQDRDLSAILQPGAMAAAAPAQPAAAPKPASSSPSRPKVVRAKAGGGGVSSDRAAGGTPLKDPFSD